jgi:hypothetical protein
MISEDSVGTVIIRIEVPPVFQRHVAEAIVRLSYLHPSASVETDDGYLRIYATAGDSAVVKRDFSFCLFRQKIYAETLSLRVKLLEGVMGG